METISVYHKEVYRYGFFTQSDKNKPYESLCRGESGKKQIYLCGISGESSKSTRCTGDIRIYRRAGKEHAEIFYNHLKQCSGENIEIGGTYPVDISDSVTELLKMAHHNEYEEFEDVYQTFGDTAYSEGFDNIGLAFHNIAKIEKTHGDRFKMYAELLEQNRLFVSDVKCGWMCLNCGHVHEASTAPVSCPVCHHNQGYFVRLELAPWMGRN